MLFKNCTNSENKSTQLTKTIQTKMVNTAEHTNLSGNACSTVGIKTPEIALYNIESQTPTIFTTVEEPNTGSM